MKCKHKYGDPKRGPCPYSAYNPRMYDGTPLCIFHAPPDKSERAFYTNFAALHDSIFRKVRRGKNVAFDFEGFVFPGDAAGRNYHFPERDYGAEIIFRKARFYKKLALRNSKFKHKVDFSGAEFSAGIQIGNVKFYADGDFQECAFKSSRGYSTFSSIGVRDNAILNFGSSVLNGHFYFADIYAINTNDKEDKNRSAEVNFNFVNINQGGDGCFLISGNTNVEEWLFYNSPSLAATVDFGAGVQGITRKLVCHEKKGETEEDKQERIRQIVHTARAFRVNFENKRAYSEAGIFHEVEMDYRLKRKRETNEKRGIKTLIRLYKLTSRYGEDYRRPALFLFLLLFIVSPLIYGLVGFELNPVSYPPKTFADVLNLISHPNLSHIFMAFKNRYPPALAVSLKAVVPYVHDDFGLAVLGHYYIVVERVLAWVFATFLVLAVRRHTKR